jgi:hypothetical protein
MRGAARLLVVTLLGVAVALVAVPVVVAEPEDEVVVQQTTTPPPQTTAPSVELDPADTEADRSERNRKLVMGILSVVLVGIVIWGRSVRRKRQKKIEGGAKGK